jgi:Ethylbenzene dehydrogenase
MRVSVLFPTITAAAILTILSTGCRKAPQQTAEVVAVQATEIPANPDDPAWDKAPEHLAAMIPQDLVEPRLMTPSTPQVKIRALTNGTDLAVRMEWADANKSDVPGPAKMVDACAIQIPRKLDKEPPAPQMGEEGKVVEVTYWRADWQAAVEGRGDTIRDLYPNASIDHYPFEAKPIENDAAARKAMAARYAPARALGNIRSGPRSRAVEDLIAAGPGTLAPGPSLGSKGKGMYGKTGWSVVISRKLPEGLAPNQRTAVAFAVWQGSQQEAGARKMRTGWIPLVVRGQ